MNESEIKLLEKIRIENLISKEQEEILLQEKQREPQTHIAQIILKNHWISTQDYARLLAGKITGKIAINPAVAKTTP